jgi:REP element-mobilizing transposase RayT
MARPLRLEFAGALYHLTSRGDHRERIFLGDSDRGLFLDLLGKEISQQRWSCYAYCLMDNHYHLLIETPEANLVRGMRRLNGVYTQSFNRRHGRVGHVFQGRYKAILVDKENYLLELCRYIVLNPVRAKIVTTAEKWPWSSYRATAGEIASPKWLAADKVVSFFSGRRSNYRRFVTEGITQDSLWEHLSGQIYLGEEEFLGRIQNIVDRRAARGIAKAQRKPLTPSVDEIINTVGSAYGISALEVLDRNYVEAYWLAAYLMRRVGNLPLEDVARRVGVSPARISQIQTKIEHGKTSPKMDAVLKHYKIKD